MITVFLFESNAAMCCETFIKPHIHSVLGEFRFNLIGMVAVQGAEFSVLLFYHNFKVTRLLRHNSISHKPVSRMVSILFALN